MAHPLTAEQRDWLALSLVPGLGPKLTASLIERFGSPAAIRGASPAELRQVDQIGPALSESFARALRTIDVGAMEARLSAAKIDLLTRADAGYPRGLLTTADAPNVLYVRGSLTPADERAVALVGSRDCSGYGRRSAAKLARDLAQAGVTVVSGLARGIDGEAHRAALEAGGRTIAVLAGGLAKIYPPEHAGLAEEVAAAGALVTETPPDTSPLAGMFPARNRIISAMALGVVIVEAGEKSGALITARHAAEQGRPVFAVPGAIDSRFSAGCNALIRDGATLIRGADDILSDLDGVSPARAEPTASARTSAPALPFPPPFEGPARLVWEALAEGPKFADELCRDLGLAAAELTPELLNLEMKKVVRRLPGNRYERC